MTLKKWILFLMLLLSVMICYSITSALTQEDEKIKAVVANYLEAFANQDLDSMAKQISANYSDTENGKIVDYARWKLYAERVIDRAKKSWVNYSISDLEIIKSDLQGDKATLEIEFSQKWFDLDILREISRKQKRLVRLEKENGIWKITTWRRYTAPQTKFEF